MYRHCQHTFQYNQLVKVHVLLYDPYKTVKTVSSQTQLYKNVDWSDLFLERN